MTRLFYIITLTFLLFCCSGKTSAQDIIVRDDSVHKALIILPGLGDSKAKRKKQQAFFEEKGYDLFIPDYHVSHSYTSTVQKFESFMQEEEIESYDSIFVFSYILGSWVLNDYIHSHPQTHIRSIVYDRSPIQELAPTILAQDFNLLIRTLRGQLVEDLSNIPYPSMNVPAIQVGIIMENKPTSLMKVLKKRALKRTQPSFHPDSLHQVYHDLIHVYLDHGDMYHRFDLIGEDILSFFQHGRFTHHSARHPIVAVPYQKPIKKSKKGSKGAGWATVFPFR